MEENHSFTIFNPNSLSPSSSSSSSSSFPSSFYFEDFSSRKNSINNQITEMTVPELLSLPYREVSKVPSKSPSSFPSTTTNSSFLNKNDLFISYGIKRNFLTQGSTFISPQQKLLTIKKERKKLSRNYSIICPNFPSYCQYLQNSSPHTKETL